jgi:uncharacterized protein YndB with AHSA1/START domain
MAEKRKPEHKGRTIHTSIRSSATPQQLWDAWADPAMLAHWFPDRAEGRAVEGSTLTWYFDRFEYAMPYEVYSAVPGEHLVLTGAPPGRPRFFLEIEITQQGGSTILELTNSGFLDKSGWDEEYEGILSGWRMALAMLKLYAERYFGVPRSQFFVMRPAPFEYPDLRRYYRDRAGLAEWLTREGAIGEEGQPYALVLRSGQTATGDVMALTSWEVELSWREIDGCLGLKAFSLGPSGRAVCVHGSGWGLSEERAQRLEHEFGDALDRLVSALSARVARST